MQEIASTENCLNYSIRQLGNIPGEKSPDEKLRKSHLKSASLAVRPSNLFRFIQSKLARDDFSDSNFEHSIVLGELEGNSPPTSLTGNYTTLNDFLWYISQNFRAFHEVQNMGKHFVTSA